jgi:hypothetical protein
VVPKLDFTIPWMSVKLPRGLLEARRRWKWITKHGLLFSCYCLPSWVIGTYIVKIVFYRVGQGILGMCLWNQGGSGLKNLGTNAVDHMLDHNIFSFSVMA